MPIEVGDGRVHQSAAGRVSVRIDERAHRSHLAFRGVEDSRRGVKILEIVLVHRGAHAEPLELDD